MRIRKLQNDIADSERLGMPVKFMHLSALTPTSREQHIERHGELFTGQQMLDWWAEGIIGCAVDAHAPRFFWTGKAGQ